MYTKCKSEGTRKQPVGYPGVEMFATKVQAPADAAATARQSVSVEILVPGAQVPLCCTLYDEGACKCPPESSCAIICIPDLSSSSMPLPTVSLEIRICTASPSSCAEKDHWKCEFGGSMQDNCRVSLRSAVIWCVVLGEHRGATLRLPPMGNAARSPSSMARQLKQAIASSMQAPFWHRP